MMKIDLDSLISHKVIKPSLKIRSTLLNSVVGCGSTWAIEESLVPSAGFPEQDDDFG